MDRLIVGLGNPGSKYEKSRHNVGFMALDFLQDHYEMAEFKEEGKFEAATTEGEINVIKVKLVKPLTFMNNSGLAVQKIASYYKIEAKNVIVIYDDVDLPIGSTRIREKGSAGTHNGMKSMIERLGTEEFTRIRIGIESRGVTAPEKQDTASFVLDDFTQEEEQIISKELTKLLAFFSEFH